MSSRGGFLRHPRILLPVCVGALLLVYITLFGLPGSSLAAANILDVGDAGNALEQGTDKLETWPMSPTPQGNASSGGDDTSGGLAGAPQADPASSALRALCDRTPWQPNLTLHCHSRCGPSRASICGGLNNARDRLQACVRLAIDAGATTLRVPSVAARSETALWTVDPAQVPGTGEPVVLCAGAWFSVGRLRGALAESCPQLRVEEVCPPEEEDPAVAGAGKGAGVGVGAGVDVDVDMVDMPWRPLGGERWDARPGHAFREAVSNARGVDQDGATAGPVVVRFGDPYIAWNYTAGEEQYTVFKDLFRAIDYNPDLLALGRRITASPPLRHTPYVGVHLRASNDWPAEWGTLEEQTRAYAAELRRLRARDGDLRTVFVSCGNRSAVQYFRETVGPSGFAVLDKWAVLGEHWPEGLETVEALAFDQKAVVEYAPLLEGKYFLGLRLSSMSVIVAQARTLDEEGDFFENYFDENNTETRPAGRTLEVRGNENTRLLVISGIEDQ